jgi:hypothetical protein
MNTYSVSQADESCGTAALRHMTAEQLLCLGMREVAYLRVGTHDGAPLFVLCGADGMPLAMVDTFEGALETAAEFGLNFINVH